MRSGHDEVSSQGAPAEYFLICMSTGHVCCPSEGGMSCVSVLSVSRCADGEFPANLEA